MEPDRHYYRTMERLCRLAAREQQAISKSITTMPADFTERVDGVSFRFEDRPTRGIIDRGVKPEALSMVDLESKEITIFLMTLNDRYCKFPGDVRHELRRLMLQELADWAGIDVDWDEGP